MILRYGNRHRCHQACPCADPVFHGRIYSPPARFGKALYCRDSRCSSLTVFSLQQEIGVIVIERSRVQSNDIGAAAQVFAVALLAGIAFLHNTAVKSGPGIISASTFS